MRLLVRATVGVGVGVALVRSAYMASFSMDRCPDSLSVQKCSFLLFVDCERLTMRIYPGSSAKRVRAAPAFMFGQPCRFPNEVAFGTAMIPAATTLR